MNRVAFFARDLTETELALLNELTASIASRRPEIKGAIMPAGFSLYYEPAPKATPGNASSSTPFLRTDPNGS